MSFGEEIGVWACSVVVICVVIEAEVIALFHFGGVEVDGGGQKLRVVS